MMGMGKYHTVMIQMMANENMQEYQTSIVVIDETVRVAKDFLEKYPKLRPVGDKKHALKSGPGEPMLVKGYWLG